MESEHVIPPILIAIMLALLAVVDCSEVAELAMSSHSGPYKVPGSHSFIDELPVQEQDLDFPINADNSTQMFVVFTQQRSGFVDNNKKSKRYCTHLVRKINVALACVKWLYAWQVGLHY